MMRLIFHDVFTAQSAGLDGALRRFWIPACAGMTATWVAEK
jgi:hypothetical protein